MHVMAASRAHTLASTVAYSLGPVSGLQGLDYDLYGLDSSVVAA